MKEKVKNRSMRYVLFAVLFLAESVFSAAPLGESYNRWYDDGECVHGGIRYRLRHISTNVSLPTEYYAEPIEIVGDEVLLPGFEDLIEGKYRNRGLNGRGYTSWDNFSLGKPVKSLHVFDGVVKFAYNSYNGRFFWGITNVEEIVFNKTDIVYPRTSEYYGFYYADENSLFRGSKGLKRVVMGKAPRVIIGKDNIQSIVGEDVIRNIAYNVEELYYPQEYSDDWESVLKLSGCTCKYGAYTGEWSGVKCLLPNSGNLKGEVSTVSEYILSSEFQDRSIASLEIDSDTAIDSFVLKEGKVYDCAIRIVNTSDKSVKIKMPNGFVYEKFKGTNPLVVPATSTNILTVTRTKADTFLLSREELVLEDEE